MTATGKEVYVRWPVLNIGKMNGRQVKNEKYEKQRWIYINRIIGSHRHHCDSGGDFGSGVVLGTEESAKDSMYQQSEAIDDCGNPIHVG